MLGAFGIKAILALGGALALATSAAYAVHLIRASGAASAVLKITQAELESKDAARRAERANVLRLTEINAQLQASAEKRSRALADALAEAPAEAATTTCPANCFLPSF